jgi:DNA repair photolyase
MNTTAPATRIHQCALRGGITRTPEFEKKKLASFAVNCGIACGHECAYCSSKALLRMHKGFKESRESPFGSGFAIVDPGTPDRVARDAKKTRNRGLIQLCTVVDAWAPETQQHQIGRRCLQAILAEPGWSVRILTKNTAVRNDFDLIEAHKDRVLVGLSITATPEKADVMQIIEPNASSNRDRVLAMKEASARGFRTYAMFCPLLPGIADSPDQTDQLVKLAVEFHAEEVFVEPVNPRGAGLRLCQEALEAKGLATEAAAVAKIRTRKHWSQYVIDLIANVQRAMRQHSDISNLRFLLYPSRLLPEHVEAIKKDDAGVIWLGKTVTGLVDLGEPTLPMPGLFDGETNAKTQ